MQALVLAAAGVVLAAAAASWRHTSRTDLRPARLRQLLTDDTLPPGVRAGRSLVMVAAAVAILLEPVPALRAAAFAAGLFVLYRGVEGLLRAGMQAGARLVSAERTRRLSVPRLAAPIVAIGALAVAFAVIATGGGDEVPAATPETCNGYVALCNRQLNDVSFAATHNSMASVTIPRWLFGQQDGTIKDQLEFGIRGLLIDSYYGDAIPGGVRTDLRSLPKREITVKELGKPAVEAAERIRARLGHQGAGKRGIFLCHGFCEIGAVPLDSALADLRSFLVSNPGEVVIIINQDEGVTPADIASAFERAGLLGLVYRGPLGPFRTLRSMIDSDQGLVVMAENDAGAIPWYHLAYQHALQETPFTFKRATQLTEPSQLPASCRPNRGPSSAPLFLVNHWVDTTPVPRASLATIVNDHKVLHLCRSVRP